MQLIVLYKLSAAFLPRGLVSSKCSHLTQSKESFFHAAFCWHVLRGDIVAQRFPGFYIYATAVPETSCWAHIRRAIRCPNRRMVCAFRKRRFWRNLAWQGNVTRDWERWCGFPTWLGNCKHIPVLSVSSNENIFLSMSQNGILLFLSKQDHEYEPWLNKLLVCWNLPDICLKSVSLPICWPS